MKAISPEQLRILVAAAESRLRMTTQGRYVIEGEERPDRRERERLVKRGLLATAWAGPARLTERGIEALRSAPLTTDEPAQGSFALERSRQVRGAVQGATSTQKGASPHE